MPKDKEKQDLTKKVIKQIHERSIKMRPHAYFIVGSLFLAAGLIGAMVTASFFIGLFSFNLRTHAPFGYLRFGPPGWNPFLATFPWLPLLVAAVGLAVGIVLLRRYDISYRKSFAGIAIAMLIAILAIGLISDFSGLHKRLGRTGPFQPFYQGRFVGRDWLVGEVLSIEDRKIVVATPEGDEVAVTWSANTRLPLGFNFQEGDSIRAVGQWEDSDTFVAKGINRESDNRVRGLMDRRPPGMLPRPQ